MSFFRLLSSSVHPVEEPRKALIAADTGDFLQLGESADVGGSGAQRKRRWSQYIPSLGAGELVFQWPRDW